MEIYDLLKSKRAEIYQIALKHGAKNIRLFGSAARKEADGKSDVDLLVDLEPGRSLLDHAALWIELQKILGCKVDVITESGLKPRIHERVLKEAIPL
jgi:predicted nucleotidyltransferase